MPVTCVIVRNPILIAKSNACKQQHYSLLSIPYSLLFLFCLFAFVVAGAFAAPIGEPISDAYKGEKAQSEQYLLWVQEAVNEGRWTDALAALERAADYADVSSDISFLLAQVRTHEGKSRWAVLEVLERAIAADQWRHYGEAEARFFAAEQLVALRDYSGALMHLSKIMENADVAALRLAALKGHLFKQAVLEAMNFYPRDPRPLRIFFAYAAGKSPDEIMAVPAIDQNSIDQNSINQNSIDQNLMELALKRLPFLLEADPELAWMAVPFIEDIEEARRMMAAYRAGSIAPVKAGNFKPSAGAIPIALNIGLIDDTHAVEELFSMYENSLDRDIVISTYRLLRSEEGRAFFTEKLLSYSGVITADDDGDGFVESYTVYRDGALCEYSYDEDQDRLADLYVSLNDGVPQWAQITILPEVESDEVPPTGKALILWERYPSVLRAEMDGAAYIPRPGEFQFAPIGFTELAGSHVYRGLLYPGQGYPGLRLNRRTLAFFSLLIQRPSEEFKGAVEWIELDHGIPRRATEILNGRPVSITEFEQGRPVWQRLDLDLDSRMETIRRFRQPKNNEDAFNFKKMVVSSESDWNGDGLYEYAEEYLSDGSVVYSWDMDGSGIRSYSEKRTENQ